MFLDANADAIRAAYFGIGVVSAVVFFLGALIFGTDAYFAGRKFGTLGQWVVEWGRAYPFWVLFFSFFLGALLGHLFTKPPLW